MSEWISVKERLPETGGSYVIWHHEGGFPSICYFSGINNEWDTFSAYDITHWMPLPEPPKEECNYD